MHHTDPQPWTQQCYTVGQGATYLFPPLAWPHSLNLFHFSFDHSILYNHNLFLMELLDSAPLFYYPWDYKCASNGTHKCHLFLFSKKPLVWLSNSKLTHSTLPLCIIATLAPCTNSFNHPSHTHNWLYFGHLIPLLFYSFISFLT